MSPWPGRGVAPVGTPGAPVRVLLADDQSLIRAGFAALLDDDDDLQVVGSAGDGAHAVALARTTRPDVVLMDIRMPGTDGLSATRQIISDPDLATTRVLVLTTFDDDEYLFAALKAGASGFLLKGMEPEDLVAAVKVVAEGEALLAPSATRKLIAAYSAGRAAQPRNPPKLPGVVSEREVEVLKLVAQGMTNAEIAAELVVSPLTIKSHVSRILTKLGARDRVQLVVLAYETGVVTSQHES